MKYLFEATYKDGSVYLQNEEDRSLIEPEKRSCFFDIKQEELASFKLVGEGHTYSVNLLDGHFEIDGIPFVMHEENDKLKDFRLIYWRRHTHQFLQDSLLEVGHQIVYRIGWQCTVDGKNYQEIMQIN